MEPPDPEETLYLLEEQQVFSESLLWDLQRQYFSDRGIEAWRQGEVPHYVTSNPTIARCYAEIVFAFWHDHHQFTTNATPINEPLYLCELGAGSGRFAFHFLCYLHHLCHQANLPPNTFCYILTDIADSNLDFWRHHPRFQPFFESGCLDIALFDMTQAVPLHLQQSGITITPGSLERPLVAIANYVFDTIPQDLYYIDKGQCQQCLTSLIIDHDPNTLDLADLLARLHIHYDYQPLPDCPDLDPALQPLLADYQHTLTDTHLLFPTTGLRCLQHLTGFSQQGVLVLSADKGDHRLSAHHSKSPPSLVHHGSFSLSVNYHAFTTFCQQSGGIALVPNSHHHSINIIGLLLLQDASRYTTTQQAYQRYVQDFSPDDFYSITKHARPYIATMTVEDILAYLRLSHYDSHQFARYLPRLIELAPEFDPEEQQDVKAAIAKVWDLYFPLGEDLDLSYQIACLLYEMDDYSAALTYFEHSIGIYGKYTGTLYNMAVCHQFLDQPAQAKVLLDKVLQYDPNNQSARELLNTINCS